MNKKTLITLNKDIAIPVLSRRTGAPCRVVETHSLVVDANGADVRLIACRDGLGQVFHTAVCHNVRLQERTIVNAREIEPKDIIEGLLLDIVDPRFDFGMGATGFDYRSVRVTDAMHGISAWPSKNGDITAQMGTSCGMLVPACDPLTPPFRNIGVLWDNGDFARNASSGVISFAGSAGVVFAAAYPDELAMRFIRRNDAMWADWLPEAPSEAMKRSAASMAEAFPKRGYVSLTPALIAKHIGKNPEKEAMMFKRGVSLKPVFWKNGLDRSGKPFNGSDPALATLFAPIVESELASADHR
jgi:hypothetical protein